MTARYSWRQIVVYHFDDEPERTGYFLKDEQGCGLIIEDFDTARTALFAPENVRLETESETYQRTQLGYLVQDLRADFSEVQPSEIQAAYELGRTDSSFAHSAQTAYSTDGARKSMISMAQRVLGIAHDPADKAVDVLADAYWRGIVAAA